MTVMRNVIFVVLILGLSVPAVADKKHKWTEREEQAIALIKRAIHLEREDL